MTKLISNTLLLISIYTPMAQKVAFEEYQLTNGLHVILHQDNTAPVVTTAVMYHVGAKDEDPERTGFAHFFEHLLFEGTKNIARGKWFEIVSANGGNNNANTSDDRTYYYETFPSNALAVGLWLESERMLHPVIDQIGLDTQNEVVNEEKKQRIDNAPYGRLFYGAALKPHVFKKHPYQWPTIGDMEHLDAATLEEFTQFNKKFYNPNNAVLVVAGDFKTDKTKELISAYFEHIPQGATIERNLPKEDPIIEQCIVDEYDPNITIPALALCYRTPGMAARDSYVLNMISTILSDGKSSRLHKKLVDDQKIALQAFSFNRRQEDYSMYTIIALPLSNNTLNQLQEEIDKEIIQLQTQLIPEREYQKVLNKFENNFITANATIQGIANSLARNYMLFNDTNLINTELDLYQSISREEIKDVANKYLNPNQRVRVNYLPQPIVS